MAREATARPVGQPDLMSGARTLRTGANKVSTAFSARFTSSDERGESERGDETHSSCQRWCCAGMSNRKVSIQSSLSQSSARSSCSATSRSTRGRDETGGSAATGEDGGGCAVLLVVIQGCLDSLGHGWSDGRGTAEVQPHPLRSPAPGLANDRSLNSAVLLVGRLECRRLLATPASLLPLHCLPAPRPPSPSGRSRHSHRTEACSETLERSVRSIELAPRLDVRLRQTVQLVHPGLPMSSGPLPLLPHELHEARPASFPVGPGHDSARNLPQADLQSARFPDDTLTIEGECFPLAPSSGALVQARLIDPSTDGGLKVCDFPRLPAVTC